MKHFDILNYTNQKLDFNLNRLELLVNFTFKITNNLKNNYQFFIILIRDRKIKELNQKYFQKNRTTDVLSLVYPKTIGEEILKIRYLGEIFVNIEYKSILKTDSSNIFYLLIIHGLLHLLGYEHNTETKRREMFNLQIKIMNSDTYLYKHNE